MKQLNINEYRADYEDYILTVSPSDMALSWQALELIAQHLETMLPRTILEYGSGISTVLLVRYAKTYHANLSIYDSDLGWAKRTMQFLMEKELSQVVEPIDSVMVEYQADFILWDFDRNPKRVTQMSTAFRNLRIGGTMYVDDMHNKDIALACQALPCSLIATSAVDQFERYGVIVQRTG